MTIKTRQISLILGDIFLLYMSLIITLFIGFWNHFTQEILLKHLLPFSILYLFWLIIFYIIGLYDLNSFKSSTFYAQLFFGLGIILVTGVFFFYFTPFFGITPKTNLFLNILIFGTLTVFWRKTFYSLFSSAYFQNKTAIVGKSPQSKELVQIIQQNPQLGYKIVAFFDSSKIILKQAQKKEIDTLILAENLIPGSPLTENLYQCLFLKIDFMDLAKAYEIIIQKIPIVFVAQSWFLENLKEKEKKFYEKTKQGTDIILAGILMILTLPLWLLIALAIKIEDKGPILYFQERIGKDKKTFLLIKFRSMIQNAEKRGEEIWEKKQDTRITKIGKFLRRTHLDEIPQMINILKGDISLVGPRPERPNFVSQLEKEIPYYHLRHLIKPGFTGWAQIKFRYARTIKDSFEKFQYDLYYLKNRSFFLDLCILLKTLQLLFKKEKR